MVHGCGPEQASSVTIGETTYVCFVVNNQQFTVIQVAGDQYARLTVPGTYQQARQGKCADVEVDLYHVESMGVKSNYRKSYVGGCGPNSSPDARPLYFPILTAIINVNGGTVTSIAWDDGCYFNGDEGADVQQCLENAYNLSNTDLIPVNNIPQPGSGQDTGLTLESCDNEPSGFCDLVLYVAWTGTDKNGNYFGSSGRRFSIFRKYALQPQYPAMQLFLLDKQ